MALRARLGPALAPLLLGVAAVAPLLAATTAFAAEPFAPERPGSREDVTAVPKDAQDDDACAGAIAEGECALALRQLRGQKVGGQRALGRGGGLLSRGNCAEYGCDAPFASSQACQCNDQCGQHGNCCADYSAKCKMGSEPGTYQGPNPSLPMGGPPRVALDYNGRAWPNMTFFGHQDMHIFAIGDWGGMDGSFMPQERPRMFMYKGGMNPGPHPYPRSRPGCEHDEFVKCYDRSGMLCSPLCGYVQGVDNQPQQLVAQQFNTRAARSNPQYVLNVGDNFYWAGIAENCGHPMDHISWVAQRQFTDIFENVYHGPGIDGKPWISVLGNHDWGGRTFNSGWDAQIAYSWVSKRWVMPAAYYSLRVEYPDQHFSVDLLMLESNNMDAQMSPDEDPDHNICSIHNKPDASCASSGGPPSIAGCATWFWDLWYKQKAWAEKSLQDSTADWQIIVTHFPCGFKSQWFAELHRNYGLDLLVTGHRHDQELWPTSAQLGGLTCFVTGGGGGISSEFGPRFIGHQYGFFDLTISKETIIVESVNYDGRVNAKSTVHKKEKPGSGKCVDYGCGTFDKSRGCQCNDGCTKFNSCCPDYMATCETTRVESSEAAPKAPAAVAGAGPGTAAVEGTATEAHEAEMVLGAALPAVPGCASSGCGAFEQGRSCQCNARCKDYGNCCPDYAVKCER